MNYYYDKYNAVEGAATYYDPSGFSVIGDEAGAYAGYAGMNFSAESGFETTGSYIASPSDGDYTYTASSATEARRDYHYDLGAGLRHQISLQTCSVDYDYSKGSLIANNLVAADGTYPADGRHTDGYWYVKRELVGNPFMALL